MRSRRRASQRRSSGGGADAEDEEEWSIKAMELLLLHAWLSPVDLYVCQPHSAAGPAHTHTHAHPHTHKGGFTNKLLQQLFRSSPCRGKPDKLFQSTTYGGESKSRRSVVTVSGRKQSESVSGCVRCLTQCLRCATRKKQLR